jgi:hypothetical protein
LGVGVRDGRNAGAKVLVGVGIIIRVEVGLFVNVGTAVLFCTSRALVGSAAESEVTAGAEVGLARKARNPAGIRDEKKMTKSTPARIISRKKEKNIQRPVPRLFLFRGFEFRGFEAGGGGGGGFSSGSTSWASLPFSPLSLT